MPRYEFQCNHCEETFEVTMSIKEKESAQIHCPKCQSSDLERLYNGVNQHRQNCKKHSRWMRWRAMLLRMSLQ